MLNNLLNQGYIVSSDEFSILHHPKEYKQTLLTLIGEAKHRILINCLYLEKDQSGQEVLQALKQRVTENPTLTVDIFVDLHRAQRSRIGENKKLTNAQWYFEELKTFNEQLVAQHQLSRNPINIHGVPCNARELFGVYHIKGFVIDDLVLYTGASINNNYCAFDSYRQDRYQLINNKVLADNFYDFTIQNFASQMPPGVQASALSAQAKKVIALFNAQLCEPLTKSERLLFKNFRQNFLLNKDLQYRTAMAPNSYRANSLTPGQLLITPVFGIGKNNDINQSVFDAIRQAKSQISIYTPYFNFTKNLTKQVINKAKEGVKVRIIVSDKTANDFYADPEQDNYSSANALPYLYEINLRKFMEQNQQYLDSGVLEVYAWKDQANSYHAKGIEIDQEIYIFTGSNLNLRSFNVDAENSLMVYDPYKELAPTIAKEYDYILSNCTKLTHYDQVQRRKDYPQRVRSTLRRASFFFIDKLAKRLF